MELDYNDIDSYKRAAAARYATPLKIESAVPLYFLRASRRRGETRANSQKSAETRRGEDSERVSALPFGFVTLPATRTHLAKSKPEMDILYEPHVTYRDRTKGAARYTRRLNRHTG